MKEFSTGSVIYLEVHNCVVRFTGHATPLIQTSWIIQACKKSYAPCRIAYLVMKARSVSRAEDASVSYFPKIHLTSWEPYWVATNENLALCALSHGNVMGFLHETHKSLWCYLDLYYHRNSTGWQNMLLNRAECTYCPWALSQILRLPPTVPWNTYFVQRGCICGQKEAVICTLITLSLYLCTAKPASLPVSV